MDIKKLGLVFIGMAAGGGLGVIGGTSLGIGVGKDIIKSENLVVHIPPYLRQTDTFKDEITRFDIAKGYEIDAAKKIANMEQQHLAIKAKEFQAAVPNAP